MKFSPQLLPNNPAGITPDWEALLTQFLTTWPLIRLMEECGEDGSALGRSLKPIPSEHIKAMTKDLSLLLQHEGYVEAELYSPNMNFAEIMHFFRSEDVTSLKSRKKHEQNGKKQSVELSPTLKKSKCRSALGISGKRCRLVMYLATLPKAVRFDHIKGIDSRTKEQRYESFKLYGTTAE
jgi:hypothetical protein